MNLRSSSSFEARSFVTVPSGVTTHRTGGDSPRGPFYKCLGSG